MTGQKPSPRPNAVIIGAAKAGTTSLYKYLSQHPEVFLPQALKELNFLGGVNQAVATEDAYLALYEKSAAFPVRMDISTSYLYAPGAARKIHDFLGPETKIIAILRDPVAAAFSLWKQMRHYGGEALAFEEALDAEAGRRTGRAALDGWDANYFYTDRYIYMPQLRRYYDFFPAKNIKVFIYEELFQDLDGGWKEICGFLGIGADYRPQNFGAVYNPASGGRRSEFLHDLINKRMAIKRLVTWAMTEKMKARLRLLLDDLNKKPGDAEEMTSRAKSQLRNVFGPDIDELEMFVSKPLSQLWSKS